MMKCMNEQHSYMHCTASIVTSLKRLLVGSISLSEDTQPDGENGAGSAKQDTDTDGSQSLGITCVLHSITLWL